MWLETSEYIITWTDHYIVNKYLRICFVIVLAWLTQMDDVSFMHVLDAFTDLSHVVDDFRLWHCVAIGGDLFEQFTPWQAGIYSGH